MDTDQLTIAVITGSVRRDRLGAVVTAWFARLLAGRAHLSIDKIDLADLTFPDDMTPHPDVESFARRVDAADAVVVVTPEYNHSFPAPLKQAIDSIRGEWKAKPVAFVSYGGTSGGLRAVESLRLVFAELHAVTVRDTVSFHNPWGEFDEDGRHDADADALRSADRLLAQLEWWAGALHTARARRPYPA